MSQLSEIVRELDDHSNLLRQWGTLVMPRHADAGLDLDYKNGMSVLAELFSAMAVEWMEQIASYHSNRVENVVAVRHFYSQYVLCYSPSCNNNKLINNNTTVCKALKCINPPRLKSVAIPPSKILVNGDQLQCQNNMHTLQPCCQKHFDAF